VGKDNKRGVERVMEEDRKHNKGAGPAGTAGGVIWFIGWLFTIGYANLVWWKIIVGIVVWPFYLGDAVLAG
jgi:hypothetical protein